MKLAGLVFLLFLLLFPLVAVNTAWAKEDSRTAPGKKLEELQERVKFKKNEIRDKAATRESRIAQKRAENINRYGVKMVERLEAMVKRLEKLVLRIESRIEKLNSQNYDMSAVKAEVGDAKSKFAQAKTDIATLKADVDTIAASENPKEQFDAFRGKVKNIISNLKEVHRILVHVIGNVKGLRVGEDKTRPSARPIASPTL